jgi:hypothetical protein
MTPNAGDGSEKTPNVMDQYETLRQAALGQALLPDARCGLMVFQRRGLWGWARSMVMTNASVLPQPRYSPPSSFTASDGHRAIIHIFAAMAINTNPGGTAHE